MSDEEPSESRSYAKRDRKKRGVNLSALEKLKQARSGATKAVDQVEDEDDVYDYVTENQYADIVNKRLEDDFLVGDCKGTGYVDTGREVFDDEAEDQFEYEKSSHSKPGAGKKRKKSNVKAPTPGGGITQFLMKGKGKKEAETKSLGTDALLDELLNSIDTPTIASVGSAPKPKQVLPRVGPSKVVSRPPSKIPKPPPTRILNKKPSQSQDYNFDETLPSFPEPEYCPPPEPEYCPPPDEDSMDIAMDDGISDELLSAMDDQPNTETEPVVKTEPKVAPVEWTVPVFVDEAQPASDVTFDKGTTPLVDVNGEKVFKMYCIDTMEYSLNNPGTVYMLGKVPLPNGNYTSGSIVVRNVPRVLFLLPRETHTETGEEVKMLDVYTEFNEVIAPKFKINKFQSKPSVKKFAWNVAGVPYECEYLEVRYSAECQALSHTLQGKTFSKVFGTTQTALEQFVLQTKIKGPGWVYARCGNPPRQQATWCTYEVLVERMGDVVLCEGDLPPPHLSAISLSLKTMLNPKTNANEIVSIAGLVQTNFGIDKGAPSPPYQQHFAAITCPTNQVFPYDFEKCLAGTRTNIESFSNERAMLGWFVAKFQKLDPDIVIGYDSVFDMDVLFHRLQAVRVPHWSRMSRFKRSHLPKTYGVTGLVGVGAMAGRLVADSKISCKELIRLRKYDLTELAKVILHEERAELQQDKVSAHFDTSQTLLSLVHHTLRDAEFNIRIMFELMALPLSHQITQLCGNIWQRTLLGGRAERNEYLLLHAFFEQGFIVPDKKTLKMKIEDEGEGEGKGKKKDTYSGGLVLEPKKGFYDTFILLLDFNSLYPSIIQEYNVCFTTVDNTTVGADGLAEVPGSDSEAGILPAEIKKLVERRKAVKQLLKTAPPASDEYLQLDIRQKALKLTANSMYGCLGFSNSRFYAKALAALVTAKGRDALISAKELVEANMKLEVVYGDTDSIMINTHSRDIKEVFQLGNKVKAEVNKMYKLLEIDIDGVFKSMLLLKKKKYAAISLHLNSDGSFREEKELKGLDIVRRDWSDLAKDAGNHVLDSILSTKSRETVLEEIHCYLTDLGKELTEGRIVQQKFIIQKSLTKSPTDYPDKKTQPHVQVALRLISQGQRVVAGDVVEYVVCEDGTGNAPTLRAYHPTELTAQPDKLSLDKNYYLSSQLHPVVSRLCHPIEGTDPALIAECLGLDPSSYRKAMAATENATSDLTMGCLNDEDRFKDCQPLSLTCNLCDTPLTIDALAKGLPLKSTMECTVCCKMLCEKYLSNKLILVARGYIKQYYSGWLECEDSACNFTSRHTPLNGRCGLCRKNNVVPVYSEGKLHNQLQYLLSLVDYKKFVSKVPKSAPLTNILHLQQRLDTPFQTLSALIEKNGFSMINLTLLFSSFGA